MTRQLYNYSSSLDQGALLTALAGTQALAVSKVGSGASTYIAIDYHPDATSTELSNGQTVATGSPYNLTHSSDDSTISGQPWEPEDLPGLELVVRSDHTPHLWQEDNAHTPYVTHAVNDADPVGALDDSSPSAHLVMALSSNQRPTLGSVSGVSHMRFNPGSTIQSLHVRNSTKGAFDFIHKTGIGSIVMLLRFESDSLTYIIDNSNGGNQSNSGFVIWRNANGTVKVRVVKGVNGTNVFDTTTTNTMLAADGFVLMVVRFNNASGFDVTLGAHAKESFSRSSAPGGGNAAGDLTIGTITGSNSLGLNASVRLCVVSNQYLADADVARISTWITRRNSRSLLRLASYGYTNFCRRYHDFSGISPGLWKDTSRTNRVTTNGDAIMLAEHVPDQSGHLNRQITAAGSVNAPTFRSSTIGSEFNGAASPNYSNLDVDASAFDGDGGAWLYMCIMLNRDNVNGSHAWYSSNSYMVFTSAFYGNPTPPYMTNHTSISALGNSSLNTEHGYNLAELHRDGSDWRERVALANERITTGNAGSYSILHIGGEFIPGWATDGFEVFVLAIACAMTNAEVESILIPSFRANGWPGF